jgi:2-methylcitrate dehydratase PrpD
MNPASSSTLPVTQALGKFVSTFQWTQASPKVKSLMPVLMIDYFRAASAGQNRSWTNAVAQLYQSHASNQEASVLYTDTKVDVARAAFINGVAAGSLDWDDSHVAAIIHPGVVIWPAALAMAEIVHCTGEELLTAVLVGYETAIRVGMSIQPEHSLRGFQGTPTCGVFGAAAACARLLKLSPEGCSNALGIAATFSCGLSQFFVSGSDIKRFHAGKAAANGVEAALLAHAGLTGPHDAIEGSQGFARAFSDRFDPSVCIANLGVEFPTEWVSLKPHVGSVRMQAAIEAANFLSKAGIKAENIQSVTIGVHGAMMSKLASTKPIDIQQAQLSTPFAVAMAFVMGPSKPSPLALSVDDYESALNMKAVWDLCGRTSCVVDAEVEKCTTSESVSGRVTVHLRDGSSQEYFVVSPKGCPQNPMSTDEVAERFLALSAHMFGEAECKKWLEQAYDVARLQAVTSLFSLKK